MLKFQQEDSPVISDEKRAELMQESPETNASGQEDEFLTVSSRDQALKKGTIILVILFAIGAGALVLMIKKSAPSPAAAGEQTQETALKAAVAQITGIKKDLAGDMESNMIYELSDVEKKQIKVSELKKNPFMLDKTVVEKASDASEQDDADSAEALAALQHRVESQAGGLKLLGIMLSPRGNSCMINDKIVYKGDKVEGFTVLAINDDSVELSSQGMTITLRITAGK